MIRPGIALSRATIPPTNRNKISQENLKKLYEGPGIETFLENNSSNSSSSAASRASALCGIPLPQMPEPTDEFKRKSPKDIFRLPPWLKVDIPKGRDYHKIKNQMKDLKLATVCEEAKCPNIGECWNSSGDKLATMTVMVLGEFCTRGCRFCSVRTMKRPPAPDPEEPEHVAQAIADWNSVWQGRNCFFVFVFQFFCNFCIFGQWIALDRKLTFGIQGLYVVRMFSK